MGIEALTHNDEGIQISLDDWGHQWISASPIKDKVQELHGKSNAKRNETDNKRQKFDNCPFQTGAEFEKHVFNLLSDHYEVVTIANELPADSHCLAKAKETFEMMEQGKPIIYQAVLWDAQNMTYGVPDFLIRSDVLHKLFPASISKHEASLNAPDLKSRKWHYLVVDAKLTKIHMNASGTDVAKYQLAPADKAQMYIYNRALGRLQGRLPDKSYLLGCGRQQPICHICCSDNTLGRLRPIRQAGTIDNRVLIADAVEQAVDERRRSRA